MQKTLLQEKTNQEVRCLTCGHLCHLKEGDFGRCGMRKNEGNVIKVYNYGKAEAVSIDPVEKKPIYHFLPGTKSLSFSASGCSFKCGNCQNWNLSQKQHGQPEGKTTTPQEIIDLALKNGVDSISYTYGEPIIFLEYALDVMRLAHNEGLKNIWVSNGYFSEKSLEKAAPYIDAINVDLKSFSEEFYQKVCKGRLQPVLKSIKRLNELTHLEITTLIIPKRNDSDKQLKEIAEFIADLDKNIPWHISRFSSRLSKNLEAPDTPKRTIERAYKIGKDAGLKHIYPGNISSEKTNTYCPNCKNIIIKRRAYTVEIKEETTSCSKCDQEINIIY